MCDSRKAAIATLPSSGAAKQCEPYAYKETLQGISSKKEELEKVLSEFEKGFKGRCMAVME